MDPPMPAHCLDLGPIALEPSHGTNYMLESAIKHRRSGYEGFIGLIFMDFPGSALVEEIIMGNFALDSRPDSDLVVSTPRPTELPRTTAPRATEPRGTEPRGTESGPTETTDHELRRG